MLSVATLLMVITAVVGACWLRLRWEQTSRQTKSFLIRMSLPWVAIYTFMVLSGWHFTSPMVNEVMGSVAVGAYSLLVLLLSHLRPKVLFSLIVILLMLPVPLALLWLPLSALSPGEIRIEQIAETLFVRKIHWDAGAMGSSGTTYQIYEKPRFVPFVERSLQSVVFDDTKCSASQAVIVLQEDKQHVLARCPWYEYQHKEGSHDFLVPLYHR